MASSRTIRWHLFMLVAAISLPLLSMLAYTIYTGAENSVSLAKSSARIIAQITASDTDRVLRTNRQALERIAERPSIRNSSLDQCDDFLEDFHKAFPIFANATVINTEGLAICSAVPQPGGKPVFVGKAEWFRRAVEQQRFVVGRPFLGPITGRWVSVLISPVRDDRGATISYLGFPVDLAAYRPSISNASLVEGAIVAIVDNQGTLIWRNIDPEAWVGKNIGAMDAFKKMEEREFTGFGIDGIERVHFVERLAEADWTVFVGVPKQTLYEDARRSVVRNSAFGTVFMLAILALAASMARRIAHPMRKLANVASAIKEGKVDLRAKIDGPSELMEVAREFNAMVDVREAQNRKLAEREEALRQSNIELERFAYVASHDLQTPLRNIVSYTQLLERRYRGRLDSDADEFITFIVDGAKHMGRLIGDLLDYARISSQGRPLAPVPARQPLDEALANLKAILAETGAEVVIGDLPTVLADEVQLVSLFQNLIGNALKYRHPDRKPQVVITAEPHSPTQWRIAVTDNGIGIEKEYFGKIFEIFQRLSPQGETEGTGIGLALCQRIVRRLGGEIRVASVPGQGSTFSFTVARPPEEEEARE